MLARYKPYVVELIPRQILKAQTSQKPLNYTVYVADKVGIRGYSYFNPTPGVYIYNVTNMLNWTTIVSDTEGVLEFALVSLDEPVSNEIVHYSVPVGWTDLWDSTNNEWIERDGDGSYEFNLTNNESYMVAVGNLSLNLSQLQSGSDTIELYSNYNNKTIDYNVEVKQYLNYSNPLMRVENVDSGALLSTRDVSVSNITTSLKRIQSNLSMNVTVPVTVKTVPHPHVVTMQYPNGTSQSVNFVYDVATAEITFTAEIVSGDQNVSITSLPWVEGGEMVFSGEQDIVFTGGKGFVFTGN
jgi:hypothetical protein